MVILVDNAKAEEIYAFFKNGIGETALKEVNPSRLDLRLFIEFFRNGDVVKIIGVSSMKTMFINDSIYAFDKEALQRIRQILPYLPKLLCLK